MAFPENEEETIALFKLAQHQLGWRIVHLQTQFPDAVIENGNGQQLIVEFEYESKNFRMHGHSSTGCDLIICYRNNWEKAPVPVWALKDCTKDIVAIFRKINKNAISFQRYFGLCEKHAILQDEIRILKIQLEQSQREMPTQSEQVLEKKETIKADWVLVLGYFILGAASCKMLPVILSTLKTL